MGKNDYFGGGSIKASPFGSRSKRPDSSRQSTNVDALAIGEEIDNLASSIDKTKSMLADQLASYAHQAMNGDISVPNQKAAVNQIVTYLNRMRLPAEALNEILVATLAKVIMNS